jgi:hypothetical protein
VVSVAMLVILGFSSKIQNEYRSEHWQSVVLDSVVGWSGAIWIWDRLTCFYSLAAAFSVAVGLCETWEWPPLMGQLSDAWSVRQMWRYMSLKRCPCIIRGANKSLQWSIPSGHAEGRSLSLFYEITTITSFSRCFNNQRFELAVFYTFEKAVWGPDIPNSTFPLL